MNTFFASSSTSGVIVRTVFVDLYFAPVIHFQQLTINKGEGSMFHRLRQNGISNPGQYIQFYGLRKAAQLNGHWVTEQVRGPPV